MRNWAGLGIAGRTRELWEPRWLSSSSSRYSPCPWLHAEALALLNATTTTAGDTAADIIITSTIGTTAIETSKGRSFSGHGAGRTHKDHWQRSGWRRKGADRPLARAR